jgi:DNA-nicking Smr family endonuclease
MTRRVVDQSEKALWHEAMRGVTRYRGTGKAAGVPTQQKSETIATVPAKASANEKRRIAPGFDLGFDLGPNDDRREAAQTVSGLDRRQALRLRRGQLAIEARLDLHGMTQVEAHRALAGFVARSHAAGKRVLLVVTGKGTRQGDDGSPSGVLRRTVPRWLAEPALRPLVLATASAVRRDGGDGALYLLLRRIR